MYIKKILIFIMVLFITGCSSKYTLIISDDSIKEDINIVIPKNMIPKLSEEEIKQGIELDDQITPFIEQDQYPINNNYNIIYNKEKKEFDDYIELNFDYSYKPEEFITSNSLARCFENYAYSYKDNYTFNINGNFYCLYSDKLEIKIQANNRIIKSNADSKKGKTHIWYITKENQNDVDIEIEIQRGFSLMSLLPYIGIVFIVSVVIFIIYILKKVKEKNTI